MCIRDRNYNLEMARFQERGALSDLSDVADRANIAPAVQDLVDQYPTYPGRTSVIPYSMMGAAVLYNREIFAAHDLEVPTTHSAFLQVCETLQEAGVTPLYSTYREPWTIAQGLVDYSVGGSIDVADFFARLRALGPDAGPDAEVSFSRDFREPLEKMLTIASFSQQGAASRGYGDGNLAFARGEAAADLVGEVDVAGRVHEVELIGLAIARGVVEAHRLRLDRDPALLLDVHIVEHLLGHLALGQATRLLDQPISKRRFTMVDMSYDTEIAYFL